MKSKRIGIIGFVVLIASAVTLVVSVWSMFERLGSRDDLAGRPTAWFSEPIIDPVFEFGGHRCTIEVVDSPWGGVGDEGDAVPRVHVFEWAGAARHLTIDWRGHRVVLPVVGDDQPGFPGLMRFDDWFRVVPMSIASASRTEDVVAMLGRGEITPRLIVAARYPAEGYDPESWGLVRRQDWPYVFVELHLDGDDSAAVTMHTATYRELEDTFAPGPYADPVSLTEDEIEERRWQHSAMLQVTPSVLYRARDKQVQAGMAAMGWTWPAAGVGVIGVVVGVGLLVSSRVRRW